MKREHLEENQSNVPIAGASPDPIFSFRSAPQRPNWAREGASSHSPRRPPKPRAPWNPPPGKLQSWKDLGAPSLTPSLHQRGSASKRKGRPGLSTRATELTGKDARPARPAPDGRAGPLPALLQLPACRGALRGPRSTPSRTPGGRSPSPVPRQPAPYYCTSARGPVDLRSGRAQKPAAAAPAVVRECEQPPASPFSSLSAPQSARGPAAPRHLTEDPGPGAAPHRPRQRPHACSAPRSAPPPQSRGRERGGAWANLWAPGGRVTPGQCYLGFAGSCLREGPFGQAIRRPDFQQLDNAPRGWTLTRVSLLPCCFERTEGEVETRYT